MATTPTSRYARDGPRAYDPEGHLRPLPRGAIQSETGGDSSPPSPIYRHFASQIG